MKPSSSEANSEELNRLRLWERLAHDCIDAVREAYAPGEVGDTDAPLAIRRLISRLNAARSASGPMSGDRALLPGLREALLWKPNTPQLENAMTYAWTSAIKSFISAIEKNAPQPATQRSEPEGIAKYLGDKQPENTSPWPQPAFHQALSAAEETISKSMSWIGGFICSGPEQEERKTGMIEECRTTLAQIRAAPTEDKT
jgi:hypothetical protein